jgi:hypothetical protein
MMTGRIIGRDARKTSKAKAGNENPARYADGSLVIDCRSCQGAQDLADAACLRCALEAIIGAQSFDRITLSRSLDVAYEGRCIPVLRELAEALRLCRSGIPLEADRQCQDCGSRPSLVLGRLADAIPHGWSGQAAPVSPAQPRAKCCSCASQVNDLLSTVASRLRSVERSVSREAFMVVGESGHA